MQPSTPQPVLALLPIAIQVLPMQVTEQTRAVQLHFSAGLLPPPPAAGGSAAARSPLSSQAAGEAVAKPPLAQKPQACRPSSLLLLSLSEVAGLHMFSMHDCRSAVWAGLALSNK